MAQRVVRHLGVACSARPRPPSTPRPGRPSPTSRSPGPTGRTSCPPRTRSPPTSRTCRPSRSTSTASPTPRARRCSSSSSPTSGWSRSWPGCAPTSPAHAWGNATFDDLLGALEEASGRDLSGWGAQWLRDHRAQPAAPVVRGRRRRPLHPVRRGAGRRPAGRRRAAHAPDRGRRLRRRRRAASWSARTASRSTSPASAPRCPELVGVAARQARAGQRRRPHLLRAAPRPGLAGHAGRPDRRHRRAAAAHAVLVGGVGDDPRGRAEGPRLRRAGGRRVRRRVRDRRGAAAAAAGADRGRLLRRRAVGRRARLADAGRRAAVPAGHRAAPARTPSWPWSTR